MRLPNWQSNLSQLIRDKRASPFDFAKWNCLMWAFADIIAVTGIDHGLDYRNMYSTEKGALKLLRKVDGVKTPQQLLMFKLGQELQHIGLARHGDIVFVEPEQVGLGLLCDMTTFGPVPGVCYGQLSYFLGQDGLVEFETLRLSGAIWVS